MSTQESHEDEGKKFLRKYAIGSVWFFVRQEPELELVRGVVTARQRRYSRSAYGRVQEVYLKVEGRDRDVKFWMSERRKEEKQHICMDDARRLFTDAKHAKAFVVVERKRQAAQERKWNRESEASSRKRIGDAVAFAKHKDAPSK